MGQYKLCDYFDLDFNPLEGYWVNNMCWLYDEPENYLVIHDDMTDREIIRYLMGIGYLRNNIDIDEFEIEWIDEGGCEITTTGSRGYPIPVCRLCAV